MYFPNNNSFLFFLWKALHVPSTGHCLPVYRDAKSQPYLEVSVMRDKAETSVLEETHMTH